MNRLTLLLMIAVAALPRMALAQDETPPPLPPPTPQPPVEPAPEPGPVPAPPVVRAAPKVREAPEEYQYEERPVPPPLGRTGFQLGIRTGASFPMGQVVRDTDLADVYGWQIPLFFDIGGKPNKHLFIGGYTGFALGGSSDGPQGCGTSATSCASFSARIGAQIQYHIAPDERVNPWIGYGIGYQYLSLAVTRAGRDTTQSVDGWEYGRFMAGLDIRVTRGFGIGPYVDFTIGEYSNQHARSDFGITQSGDINRSAAHFWLTIGPRIVFFP